MEVELAVDAGVALVLVVVEPVDELAGTTVMSTVSNEASDNDGPVVPLTTESRKIFPPLRSTLVPR